MVTQQSIGEWIIRGLGGLANMVAGFTDGGLKFDGDQLKNLRANVVRLASHYNYHAARSSLEPHERPGLFGDGYPIGESQDNGRLVATQHAAGQQSADQADNQDGLGSTQSE